MTLFRCAAARLLAMSTPATLIFATAANAQTDGQGLGSVSGQGNGMMGGGLGMGYG